MERVPDAVQTPWRQIVDKHKCGKYIIEKVKKLKAILKESLRTELLK